jgi:hypothetical protein
MPLAVAPAVTLISAGEPGAPPPPPPLPLLLPPPQAVTKPIEETIERREQMTRFTGELLHVGCGARRPVCMRIGCYQFGFSDTVIPDNPRQPRIKDALKKMEFVRQVS